MTFLDEQQRIHLRARHRRERDKRVCDRIKAILLADQGMSYQEIAEILLLSEGSARGHVDDYLKKKKISPANGGSEEKLSKEQSSKLEEHLGEHTYLYVKNIAAYLLQRWGVSYTVAGLRSWLQRHNFTYKKPALVPGKADPKKQKEWIVEYESLKSNLSPNETICFTDGVHPTHNVQLACGWIRKGEKKLIPSNTGRARINLTGALDILSHKLHIRKDKTLNSDATIAFFTQVEAAYPSMDRVHIFCDNAAYYRNKAVTKYLETSKIELHFLPPYSPNLNPIERLWKWMKQTVLYNTYYEAVESFESAIFGFFRTLQNLDPESALGQQFRRRVRDRFRVIDSLV